MAKIIVRKIVKKVPNPKKPKPQKKQPTQPTKQQIKRLMMEKENLRFCTFVWDQDKFKKIAELGISEGKIPNEFIWEILEKYLEKKE